MIVSNIQYIKNELNLVKSSLKSKDITIIGVSKGRGIEDIKQAISAGITDFGENYFQEAAEKWHTLKNDYPKIKLHFIGNLQSNKIKSIMDLFDCIHSVSSINHLKKILKFKNDYQKNHDIFIQVNLDKEKPSGAEIKDLSDLIMFSNQQGLRINGLMGITPLTINSAPYFALLHQLSKNLGISSLSMGMSNDFKEAVKFGATHIRIGSRLFKNEN